MWDLEHKEKSGDLSRDTKQEGGKVGAEFWESSRLGSGSRSRGAAVPGGLRSRLRISF